MTDADLIYNALLRVERRLENRHQIDPTMPEDLTRALYVAFCLLREEVGRGLAAERVS